LLKARIIGLVRPSAKPSSGLQQTFIVVDEMCKPSLSDIASIRMSQVMHYSSRQPKLQCVVNLSLSLTSWSVTYQTHRMIMPAVPSTP
ncbi:hypothetical protein PBRA_000497, partial [Plasmodiophora brassicae]